MFDRFEISREVAIDGQTQTPRSDEEGKKDEREKKVSSSGIEPETFRMLGERDNQLHYEDGSWMRRSIFLS